ncbi:MAG: hypothetical protein ACRDKI_03505, partial [Solirubrobacterales bacterium]
VGYAPAGLVGNGVGAAVTRYNLLFLFAYALAFAGAYLLARELGLKPWAAAVAGVAFAYAPWRLEQDGHLHVLSSGGIPLSLFLLLRGYRRDCKWSVLAGWLVAAWQVSLGFTLGLQLGYLILVAAIAAGIVWWRSDRSYRPPRGVAIATAVGAACTLLVAVLLSLPYQRVLGAHPEAHRTVERLSAGSGSLWQYLAAPEHNLVWSAATKAIREQHLTSIAEQTLFPGVVICALAIAGLVASVYSRRLRIALGVSALVLALLSLGFHTTGLGRFYPYRLLYELAPGWQGIRVPGRLNTLTSLALALLAGAGAQAIAAKAQQHAGNGRRVAIAAALALLVCIEGSGFWISPPSGGVVAGPLNPRVPPQPRGQAGITQPQLHLPITIAANRRYVFWSTDGFPKIVNGRGSVDPKSFARLKMDVSDFPSASSIAVLRALGVKSVVLHPYLLRGTRWYDAATKPVAGLGVTRERRGDLVVVRLDAAKSSR